MQYTVKIPAINGNIVPLFAVAEALAMHDATAGGTPFHAPMFDGRLTGHILALLNEVRSGSLEVCDTFGSRIAVDPSIGATAHFGYAQRFVNEPDWKKLYRDNPPVRLDWEKLIRDWENLRHPNSVEPNWEALRRRWEELREISPGQPGWKKLCRYWAKLLRDTSPVDPVGNWNFSHVKFGPTEPDKDRPMIAWKAKLKMLNKWAEKRGDSFVISHDGVGWNDERGYVVSINGETQDPHQGSVHPKSKPDRAVPELALVSWKNSARRIGEEIAKLHKSFNLDQIAKKVHERMLKEKSVGAPGMTGRGNRVPSAGTIRRHALKGIKP